MDMYGYVWICTDMYGFYIHDTNIPKPKTCAYTYYVIRAYMRVGLTMSDHMCGYLRIPLGMAGSTTHILAQNPPCIPKFEACRRVGVYDVCRNECTYPYM